MASLPHHEVGRLGGSPGKAIIIFRDLLKCATRATSTCRDSPTRFLLQVDVRVFSTAPAVQVSVALKDVSYTLRLAKAKVGTRKVTMCRRHQRGAAYFCVRCADHARDRNVWREFHCECSCAVRPTMAHCTGFRIQIQAIPPGAACFGKYHRHISPWHHDSSFVPTWSWQIEPPQDDRRPYTGRIPQRSD